MKRLTLGSTLVLAVLAAPFAQAEANWGVAKDEHALTKNGVILNGYDAVAYFTENKAVKGKAEYGAEHKGATYHFATAENRDMFLKNPEKYAPQYGGWCAYGVALGKKFKVNGKAFEVVAGKLYVNKDAAVAKTWKTEKTENIEKADEEWPSIKGVPAKKL